MAKKFVDLNNLKILWNEINEKFLRSSQVEEFMDLITPDILSSSPEIQLRPNREWDNISEDFYNQFISFVNTQHNAQLVIDADGCYWDVINKTFYDKSMKKYTGLILSINDTPVDIDKDTPLDDIKNDFERFWYIKSYRNTDENGHYVYSLKWVPFSIPWGDYIEARVTRNDLADQLGTYDSRLMIAETDINTNSNKIGVNINNINNLLSRVETLEKELGIVSGMLVSTNEFTITPTDNAGRLLSGCSVLEIVSVNSEDDNYEENNSSTGGPSAYPIYEGNINDIVLYEYVGSQIRVKITGKYAIKMTIKKDKYDNHVLFIPYDSNEKNIKIVLKPETVTESSLEPRIYNKYPIKLKFNLLPDAAVNSVNSVFSSLVKSVYQYGVKNENGKVVVDKTSKNRIFNSNGNTGTTSELSTSYSNKLLITCVGMNDIEIDVSKNYYMDYSSNNPWVLQTPNSNGDMVDYIEFRYKSVDEDYVCKTYVFDEYGRVCNYSLSQFDYKGNHGSAEASDVYGKCELSLSKDKSTILKVQKTGNGSNYYQDTYYICPSKNQGLLNIQLQKETDYNKTVLICTVNVENREVNHHTYKDVLQYFLNKVTLVHGDDTQQLENNQLLYEVNTFIPESGGSAILIYTVYNVADVEDLGGVHIVYNEDSRFYGYESSVIKNSGEHNMYITMKMKAPYADTTIDPFTDITDATTTTTVNP